MRDRQLDFLRFLGLVLIVLAHIEPPSWLFQLRNFDVPLMVLVSGASFALSFRQESYKAYLWKRVKRLLFPVWLFLAVYFVGQGVAASLGWAAAPMPKKVMETFFLSGGLTFIWVVRVFLLVALAAPWIVRKMGSEACSDKAFFVRWGAVYLGYELLLAVLGPQDRGIGKVFENTVLYLVPYGLLFALGLRWKTFSRRQIDGIISLAIGVFGGLAFYHFQRTNGFVPTQEFKYPPSAYYLSYAIAVSGVVWRLSSIGPRLVENKLVAFMAQNSLWIYLWHIPFLEIGGLPIFLRYPMILGGATAMVWLQQKGLEKLVLPRFSSEKARKNLSALLSG